MSEMMMCFSVLGREACGCVRDDDVFFQCQEERLVGVSEMMMCFSVSRREACGSVRDDDVFFSVKKRGVRVCQR